MNGLSRQVNVDRRRTTYDRSHLRRRRDGTVSTNHARDVDTCIAVLTTYTCMVGNDEARSWPVRGRCQCHHCPLSCVYVQPQRFLERILICIPPLPFPFLLHVHLSCGVLGNLGRRSNTRDLDAYVEDASSHDYASQRQRTTQKPWVRDAEKKIAGQARVQPWGDETRCVLVCKQPLAFSW
jgi:hypothetical protein